MESVDVVIIGAGVTGLSAACHLATNAKVVVLERESQPAYHASGRSAAVYIQGYENRVVADLTAAAGAYFFERKHDGHPLVKPRGGLTVAGHDELRKLERYLATWQGVSPTLQPITVEEARERVPVLRNEWLAGAAFDPAWQSIDVHGLLQSFQAGLRDAGGSIRLDAEVTAVTARGSKWVISYKNQQIETSFLVNAAGAWASEVAGLAGLAPLPLTPCRRTAVIVPIPEGGEDWPLVHTLGGQLYFKPETPGLMVSPEDETPSPPTDAQPEELDIAIAVDRLQNITDLDVTRVLHSWAGLRTFAPDRHPIIGVDPQAPNFVWLAGLGGFGVQTAPATGELVANVILHGRTTVPEISPSRF